MTDAIMDRRRFLAMGAALAAATALPIPAFARGDGSMSLRLKHSHTGEKLSVSWFRNGRFDQTAVGMLHVIMRDWREDRAVHMDLKLYVLLSMVQYVVGLDRTIMVNSAYRTPKTNQMLAERGGAAVNSQHLYGRAVDITIPGVDTALVRDMAVALRIGGVGHYPKSNFVHLDTGRVRTW